MATVAGAFSFTDRRPDLLSGTPRAHAIDRWIFVAMATWFIAIVLTGFIPDAIGMVADAKAGTRPPLPPILHVHAVAMGSFLLLLLAQSVLMATGRCALHKRLGMAAFALVPVLVVVGLILAPTIYHQVWNYAQTGPRNLRPEMERWLLASENILLLQIRIGVLFPLCMGMALSARVGNVGFHKRMIFLATALPLPAAFDRMNWLPNSLPASPWASDLYILAAVAPLFLWDLVRNRRVHGAYVLWLALNLPAAVLVYALWNTPWWHATARQIMGV